MANTRTLTVPFHLPYDTQSPSTESDLGKKIAQIINQKGHFRGVTEETLLAEHSDEEDNTAGHDEAFPKNEGLTPEKRREELWASKQAMAQQWTRGWDELLTTLDFLSLLISKQSAAARSGMSPSLRDAKVPAGSFEPRLVKASPSLKSRIQQEAEVSRGWKAQGFESAFTKFSAASERLGKEAERESQFWAETASLKEKGWKVSRHPRDSKTIGLHFGSAESASQFSNRGFAPLRQDEDGHVYLDRPSRPVPSRKVRIRVDERGRSSISEPAFATSSDSERGSANEVATRARDELVEAELFYEISREARLISNQDVSARAKTISFGIGQDSKVVISHVDTPPDLDVSAEDNEIARSIRLSLKGLLLAAHEARMQRRSRMSQALSTRPRGDPEMPVLRPLIAHLRHQAALRVMLERVTSSILRPLERAGVMAKFNHEPRIEAASETDSEGEPLLRTGPLRDTFCLILLEQRSLEVSLTSFLGSPIYGTQYGVTDADFGFAKITGKTYSDIDSMMDTLHNTALLSLMHLVKSSAVSSGVWEATRPLKGELSYQPSPTRKVTNRLRIQLQSQSLMLRVIPASRDYATGNKVLAWNWRPDIVHVTGSTNDVGIAEEDAKKLSFMDVVSKATEE